MTRLLSTVAALVAMLVIGIALGRWWPSESGMPADAGSTEREILYYKAPMDPNYRSDSPGKSPMGMDLVPVYADEAAGVDPGVVAIDPRIVNNLGVRTARAHRGPLSRRIETVGYIGYDEDTLHHIHTRVDGWIEKLSVKASGDPVTRGQVLFELYSPTLVNAQEEYLAMLKSRTSGLADASRARLIALGVTRSEIERLDRERTVTQRIRVYAQADGFLTDLGVREGTYITPATDVMSIAELDQVWVLVEVFERQAAWVKAGQRAEVVLDYLPGERRLGTVDYVYPELDQMTRSLKVRLRFDNPAEILRPNMFARVTIFGTETEAVVHVPQEALIRGGAFNRVVLALGDGQFRAQPVEVGIEAGDRIEIRSGLTVGDQVVTSGQFLIDSESNIETALARMDAPEDEAPPMRVEIAAVVRSVNAEVSTVRLEHPAIAEWSWPAMTMDFDVSNADLLRGLTEGDAVEVTIEKHADGHSVVTDINPVVEADHANHDTAGNDAPMDHSDHSGEPMQ